MFVLEWVFRFGFGLFVWFGIYLLCVFFGLVVWLLIIVFWMLCLVVIGQRFAGLDLGVFVWAWFSRFVGFCFVLVLIWFLVGLACFYVEFVVAVVCVEFAILVLDCGFGFGRPGVWLIWVFWSNILLYVLVLWGLVFVFVFCLFVLRLRLLFCVFCLRNLADLGFGVVCGVWGWYKVEFCVELLVLGIFFWLGVIFESWDLVFWS